jgi:phage terminase large subunit GpA-like protein
MHFPEKCNDQFFQQLTAEKRVIVRTSAGFSKYVWKLKENARNEMLDCKVYNIAAVELLRPNFEKLKERLEEKLEALRNSPAAESEADPMPEPPKPSPSLIRKVSRSSGRRR